MILEHEEFIRNLKKNRFEVSCFETAAEAVQYLTGKIQNKTVGIGDSHTIKQMGLADALAEKNEVTNLNPLSGQKFHDAAAKTMHTDIFLTSVNAASESGHLVNMDSSGNRISASLYGHEKVYFIFSANKIMPDLEQAIWRVRNVAAPKNAQRFGLKTPCAVKGDRCYDCSSPDRICNVLTIYLKKEKSMEEEVILINEPLGF